MKKNRASNIELFRIVLMLMIITHHVIVHGLGLKNITSQDYNVTSYSYIEILLNSFFVIGVNGFVFISGYFGIKFNLKRIISIVMQAIAYSVSFYLLFCLINNIDFNIASFIKSFFPISRNIWWFITTYIGLYFIAPFLNAGITNIKKNELRYILIGLFILNCILSFVFGGISTDGYTLFNFIFIYLIGRFIKQNNFNLKHPKIIFLLCSGIITILGFMLLLINKHTIVWYLFYYNNPILILSSISLFFIFLNLKIRHNSYINTIAQLVLGVYMIHDYKLIRYYITDFVDSLKNNLNLALLLVSLIILILSIFIVSSLIEYARVYLFNAINNRVFNSLIIHEYKSKAIKFASNVYKKTSKIIQN